VIIKTPSRLKVDNLEKGILLWKKVYIEVMMIPIIPETAKAFDIIEESKLFRNKVFAPTSNAPRKMPRNTD
jgi:hypothetical protein